jgi:hypothetical protein
MVSCRYLGPESGETATAARKLAMVAVVGYFLRKFSAPILCGKALPE